MSKRSERRRAKFLRRKARLGNKPSKKYYKRNKGSGSPGDYTYRAGWQDKHHITNKTNGGTRTPENLISLDRHRHNALHLLFGNMDFLQIIRLLIRCLRFKNHPDCYESESVLEDYENGRREEIS